MVDIANGPRSDVTVVLLGHDQAAHRERALHYYRQAGIACLALEALEAHSPGAVCSARLSQALQQVATPLVNLALDADFVQAPALDRAADCLSANPLALGAQGYALGYVPGNGQVAYYKLGHAFPAQEGEGASARIRAHALANQPAWRAVVRVERLRSVLKDLPEDLDFASWRVALSLALLADGAIIQLDQTDVICELAPRTLSPVAREEQLVRTVRLLRAWDAERDGTCTGDAGFVVLNRLVRGSYDAGEPPLLFTSRWTSVIADPDRQFEPRQYIEMPYYQRDLFQRLAQLEFLCHGWPTGQEHRHALEGTWVRQRELLEVHPNDTKESLQQRYWQALALGLFSRDVCQRLLATLEDEVQAEKVRELSAWLERLDSLPCQDVPGWLATTASGRLLQVLADATPASAVRQRVLAQLAKRPGPQIGFVVADLQDDDLALQATFDSLLAAGLRNFKLVVLKAGKPPAITTARDTLHFVQVEPGNWVSHLNHALRQLPSEWVMLLQAGDILAGGGLLRLQLELGESPACDAICADEIQRDEEGRLLGIMRPGSDLDLLRSQPALMSRHWLLRRQAVLDLGCFDSRFGHALEYDLLLRLVEERGLGGMAHMDEYLVIGGQASEPMRSETVDILDRHLKRLGYQAQVSDQGAAGLAIDFRHNSTPLVSILMVHEGDRSALERSLTSLFQRTRYPRYEIVLICTQEQHGLLSDALRSFAGRLRLVAAEVGENLFNQAARHARGEYLLLLSERCQVISPAWIEAMLNQAQRPEVGVVGARLVGMDGSLAHAGYDLLAGPRVHAPWASSPEEPGSRDHWSGVVRGCPAVSGNCLMVRAGVFEQCDGLQGNVAADVDLCLAVTAAGSLVVWTPQAQLMIDGAVSPAPEEAAQALLAKWPGAFARDVAIDGRRASAQASWLAPFK
ncbi:glycosyltransferase [Pseudomonas putida]|uniref:glycosyltransferase n=1 Tax=Pseudomonas putida TaxID=303 RepID=UPI002AC50B4C|nr:glycosyltransferase [Pseudomonas putida]MDZ5110055.1 glycosyltransferase [Pseudomonas putida]